MMLLFYDIHSRHIYSGNRLASAQSARFPLAASMYIVAMPVCTLTYNHSRRACARSLHKHPPCLPTSLPPHHFSPRIVESCNDRLQVILNLLTSVKQNIPPQSRSVGKKQRRRIFGNQQGEST
ncbi:hypothetical protein HRR83_006326 [Exophiala dermatitidis]|nr:hypothetical protein HRR74_007298 [Exophiala dermatitidis]KAJ4530517.1 hypothetical protein HRR76_008226 [Exophiala dermatitidis]KAJ4571823.1 hypothetical protein HRR82_007106 [Exophiala dermatitidis]KAJ4576265.1 hypothetical protein HRR81_004153 [Exophiala dermatitidis]KAJ4593467.1 hypothetical protein HRR83_006326 [Exophiala dermatitidis]